MTVFPWTNQAWEAFTASIGRPISPEELNLVVAHHVSAERITDLESVDSIPTLLESNGGLVSLTVQDGRVCGSNCANVVYKTAACEAEVYVLDAVLVPA